MSIEAIPKALGETADKYSRVKITKSVLLLSTASKNEPEKEINSTQMDWEEASILKQQTRDRNIVIKQNVK